MKKISKKVLIIFVDILCLLCAYSMGLLLRFDLIFSSIPRRYLSGHARTMCMWIIVTVGVFWIFRLYHSVWSLVGMSEAKRICEAYMVLIPVYAVSVCILGIRMPISYYCAGYVFSFGLTLASRVSYRVYRTFLLHYRNRYVAATTEQEDRIMIIGAGVAGQTLIKELRKSEFAGSKICCIIDDNPEKKGKLLEGIPVVGNRYDIVSMAAQYQINHIIYAIAHTSAQNRKSILHICKETNCQIQVIPGIYQLVNGEVSVSQLRSVDINDLLGREQINVNNEEIFKILKDKVVMVTGGGGSIGSELCRQIAKAEPKQLVVFDIYENNAYDIQQELKKTYPNLNLEVLIGSVRNTSRINSVMHQYRPELVFHAAAHKHVPLMEDSPNEAVKNNVIGTYKTALAAAEVGVKKFVLISTDKAVNPTNIMGASKRLCEMIVQMMNRKSKTEFVAVRFGNVLGSNGSVIPLFKKQIAEGGPVTVTDKNIIRYFMTIPEAVSLILQACCYAEGGEIYVLDMGEPVKIDDMARNLIRLSGYTPDVDIKIVYTGLRPGEKLYEELLMDAEGLKKTDNKLIYIGEPIEMDDEAFQQKIQEMDEASRHESDRIKEIVAEIVPTYQYRKAE